METKPRCKSEQQRFFYYTLFITRLSTCFQTTVATDTKTNLQNCYQTGDNENEINNELVSGKKHFKQENNSLPDGVQLHTFSWGRRDFRNQRKMAHLDTAPAKLEDDCTAAVVDHFDARAAVHTADAPIQEQWKRKRTTERANKMPNFSAAISADSAVIQKASKRGTNSIGDLTNKENQTSVGVRKAGDSSEKNNEVAEPRVSCEIVQNVANSMCAFLPQREPLLFSPFFGGIVAARALQAFAKRHIQHKYGRRRRDAFALESHDTDTKRHACDLHDMSTCRPM